MTGFAIIALLLAMIATGHFDYNTIDTVRHKEIATDKYGSPHLIVFMSGNEYICTNYGIYDNLSVGCRYNFTYTESKVIIKINKNLSDMGGED